MVLDDPDFVSLVETFGPALKRLQRVSGVSSVALLQSVAETVGQELAKAMTSTSSDSVVDELRLLFVSLGLGKISVEGRGPRFKLTIKDCSGCTLTETMLRAIFEERLGVETNVKLLSRRGKESCMKTCKFMVALGPNPSEEQ